MKLQTIMLFASLCIVPSTRRCPSVKAFPLHGFLFRITLLVGILATAGAGTAFGTSFLVSWDPPDSEVPSSLNYYVYYSNTESQFPMAQRFFVEGQESLEVDLPCDPDLTYYFAVQTVDRAGNTSGKVLRLPVRLATGPGPGEENSSRACLFSSDNTHNRLWNFDTYDEASGTFGLCLACGNLLGGSAQQLVVAPGPGSLGPEIRVYLRQGVLVPGGRFQAFGYSQYGSTVACGDIDGDGIDELVVGAGHGPSYGPSVRIFEYSNDHFVPMNHASFMAFPVDQGYGVNVACGDLDADGRDEIVVGGGPGPEIQPRVRVFKLTVQGIVEVPGADFLAYGTDSMGVNLACGDVDGDGYDEIITGPGPGTVFGPHVRAFDYIEASGEISPVPGASFFAYSTPRFGVVVASADVNHDCYDEVITCPGPGPSYCSHVRGFRLASGQVDPLTGFDFFPYLGTADDSHGAHLTAGLIYPPS